MDHMCNLPVETLCPEADSILLNKLEFMVKLQTLTKF